MWDGRMTLEKWAGARLPIKKILAIIKVVLLYSSSTHVSNRFDKNSLIN